MDLKPVEQVVTSPKRKFFSLRQKKALLEEWQRSGLTLWQFAKNRGITPSVLYLWQKKSKIQPNNKNNNTNSSKVVRDNIEDDWLPVMPAATTATMKSSKRVVPEELVQVKLILAQKFTARVKISRPEVINFFKELYHAITVIR